MRRAVLGAVALAGFTVAVLVAMLGWSPRGHQPNAIEWLVQGAVLIAAMLLVASRVTGKR